jgi:hypothetical protein
MKLWANVTADLRCACCHAGAPACVFGICCLLSSQQAAARAVGRQQLQEIAVTTMAASSTAAVGALAPAAAVAGQVRGVRPAEVRWMGHITRSITGTTGSMQQQQQRQRRLQQQEPHRLQAFHQSKHKLLQWMHCIWQAAPVAIGPGCCRREGRHQQKVPVAWAELLAAPGWSNRQHQQRLPL